jgi:lipopolysaccharide biosynthesis protein
MESYKNFIHDVSVYLKDKRYVLVNNKKVLIVYKPQDVPDCKKVLEYWRQFCRSQGVGELYIIGCWTCDHKNTVISDGFDAVAEFQPGSIIEYCKKINETVSFVNDKYFGAIYSYEDLVESKIYQRNKYTKMYHAVMPMWDNTPRRNNKGSVIFDGAMPMLYKKWLKDIIKDNNSRDDLDDNLVFVNAWNEWGEGAYLEPDRKYGYAYLQATKEAIEECRNL